MKTPFIPIIAITLASLVFASICNQPQALAQNEPRRVLPAAPSIPVAVTLADGRRAEISNGRLLILEASGRADPAPAGEYRTREGRVLHVAAGGMLTAAPAAPPANPPAQPLRPERIMPQEAPFGTGTSGTQLRAKEPKTPADSGGTQLKPKLVTWDYLRMNNPQAIAAFVNDVQDGKVDKSLLNGLAPEEILTHLIKNTPRRQTLTQADRKALSLTKNTPHEPLVSHTARGRVIAPKGAVTALNFSNLVFGPGVVNFTKIKIIDAGVTDMGQFAVGDEPSFIYEGVVPTECDFNVHVISKNFRIFNIATLTGEFETIGKKTYPKTDTNLHDYKPGASVHIKAGQTFRIALAPTQAAAAAGLGDIQASWVVDSPSISYGGALKLHYYQDAISCVAQPAGGILNLAGGDSTWLPVKVGNPNPKAKTITVSVKNELAGVTVEPQAAFSLGPNETKTVNFHVTAAKDALENRSASVTVTATDGTATSSCYVPTRIYLPLYAWSYSGSCGKIDFSGDLTIASNGLWHWTGHQHDNSTWYGDDWAMSFVFGQSTPNGQHLGFTDEGTLGAEHSGPNVDRDFNYSGQNTDIQQHFGAYADMGWQYHYWVADDFSQIGVPVGQWAAKAGLALLLAP